MTKTDLELAKKLLKGPVPLSLLLHIQESAQRLGHGTIELIFTGKDAPIDVVTKQRTRFKA